MTTTEFPFIYFKFRNGSASDACHETIILNLIETKDMSLFVNLCVIIPKYRHSTLSTGNHSQRNVFYNFVIFVPLAFMHEAMVSLLTAETDVWNWNFIYFHLKTISKVSSPSVCWILIIMVFIVHCFSINAGTNAI